jgi:hypothetical protein
VGTTETRRKQWLFGGLIVVGLLAVGFVVMLNRGSGDRTPPNRRSEKTERDDPLEVVRDTLRREAKIDVCKTAAAQLNMYLSRPVESKPAPASPLEKDLLASRLRLTPEEQKEVAHDEFTTLDAHYLDESLLFRDAIASLKLDHGDKTRAGALERARLTFAWAMRQTWLNESQSVGRPLPAAYALRNGFGSAAERAGVALAALQQAGFDAALIGQKKDDRTLRAWAVGVLIDGEVYLFDPRAGKPLVGANDKLIATLKQVQAKPDLARAAIDAIDTSLDASTVVKESQAWLTPPLSALASRMRWLQTELSFTPPVVLGVEPVALVERFTKAEAKPELWNPPADVASRTRRLSGFLGPAEGGFEPQSERLVARYRSAPVPLEQLPKILAGPVIEGEPRERIVSIFIGRFIFLMQEPGHPRDLLLRGHFDEASQALVAALDQLGKVQERIRSEEDLEKGAAEWIEQMRSAYATYLRERNDPASGGGAAKARVDALYDSLFKGTSKMTLLIEREVSEPYRAAVTYQQALCMHEQAERRSRDRSPPAAKRDAWQNARAWWENNYLSRFSDKAWIPRGQLDQARQFLADAKRELAALPSP